MRYVRGAFGQWRFYPYGPAGRFEHCGRDEFHTQHRSYASVYKLRRNFRFVFDGGDGNGTEHFKANSFESAATAFVIPEMVLTKAGSATILFPIKDNNQLAGKGE
jgi:hypothetical protein